MYYGMSLFENSLCLYIWSEAAARCIHTLCSTVVHTTPMFLLYNELKPNKLQQQQQFLHSFKPAAVLLIMTTNKLLHQQTNWWWKHTLEKRWQQKKTRKKAANKYEPKAAPNPKNPNEKKKTSKQKATQ